MAASATAQVQFQFGGLASDSKTGLSDTNNPSNLGKIKQYTAGTGAGQVNRIYMKLQNIVASGSATFDLTSLTDLLNLSVSFSSAKGLLIWLPSTADDPDNGSDASSILIGDAGSNPAFVDYSGVKGWYNTNFRVFNGCFSLMTSINGVAIASAKKNLLITNEDSVEAANVYVGLIGVGS